MLTSMITTTAALNEFCSRMAHEPFITVDTEFLRETTYWPILCLVQIAGAKEAAAIDALAPNLDLTSFYDLLKNTQVTKVFHAARQDLEIIWKACGSLPSPLFDTQIAAQCLGFGEQIGYGDLVKELIDVVIDKANRFTDWTKRPLSNAQVDYALGDVTHLYSIYPMLLERLEKNKRRHWMNGEIDSLLTTDNYEQPPEKAYEKFASRARKPRELAILMELSAWREREAQARDVPRGRIIKDESLLDIATRAPTSIDALGHLRSIPKGYEASEDGSAIVEVVKLALKRDMTTLPPLTRNRNTSQSQRASLELLRVLLKAVSENEGVAPRIIASSEDLEIIATEKEPDCPALHTWRREIFGEQALLLKDGKLALVLQNGRVETRLL